MNRIKYLIRDAFFGTIFSLIISLALYTVVINISLLNPFEKAFEDFNFTDVYYSKEFYKKESCKEIVLVNIKHSNRLEIANAISKILEQNPKAIGIDAIFKDKKLPIGDSILKMSLNQSSKIVSCFYPLHNGMMRNHDFFRTEKSIEGYIDFNLEGENEVIREFTGVTGKKDTVFSFATQLAIRAGYMTKNEAQEKLSSSIPIKYIGNQNAFLILDIDEILVRDTIPALKNAIVIMGYLGTPTENRFDIEDKHFTPLNPKYVGKSTPDMNGTVIHANILNMLIQKNFLHVIPKTLTYFLAFIFSFVLYIISLVIYKKSDVIFHMLIKFLQLVSAILILYVSFLLLERNTVLHVSPIIVLSLLGLELVYYFAHLLHYLKHKLGWNSYLDL